MIYFIYRTSGQLEKIEREEKYSLEEMQAIVGGSIEFVDMPDGSSLVVNEDGIGLRLPRNNFVTPPHQEFLLGDIIHGVMVEESGGNEFHGFEKTYELQNKYPYTLKTINPALFEEGRRFSIIYTSEMLATTVRMEVVATGDSSSGRPVFKDQKKGSRKLFVCPKINDAGTLIFENISKSITTPFCTDMEYTRSNGNKRFSGNAMLNFMGKPEEIKEWVLTKNLNPFFNAFDRVLHLEEQPGEDDDLETLLFPDAPAQSIMTAEKQAEQRKR